MYIFPIIRKSIIIISFLSLILPFVYSLKHFSRHLLIDQCFRHRICPFELFSLGDNPRPLRTRATPAHTMMLSIAATGADELVAQYLNAESKYISIGKDPKSIRRVLIDWYRSNRRKMPWRGDRMGIIVDDDTDVAADHGDIVDVDRRSTLSIKKDDDAIPISAYGVWVSEVMLQQTRVDTVIAYWYRWMEAYPSVAALSCASPDDVNKLWAGLGYYRRAQMLLKGAKVIMDDYNGVLPDTVDELLKIPGIGPYTAGAIASIAYNKCEAIVDGNVIRVLSRLFAIKLSVGDRAMDKLCWQLARELVSSNRSVDIDEETTIPPTTTPSIVSSSSPTPSSSSSWSVYDNTPRDFNQALMELGAIVCKPLNPLCTSCPLNGMCSARQLVMSRNDDHDDDGREGLLDIEDTSTGRGGPVQLPRSIHDFPFKLSKKKPKDIIVSVFVLRALDPSMMSSHQSRETDHKYSSINSSTYRRYLFVRRPDKGLLANQWEFPSIIIDDDDGKGEGKTVTVTPENNLDGDTTTGDGRSNGSNISSAKSGGRVVSDDELRSPWKEYLKKTLQVHIIDIDDDDSRVIDQFNGAKLMVHDDDVGVGTSRSSSLSSDHPLHNPTPSLSPPPYSMKAMILQAEGGRRRLNEPTVHVFSHQKHHMHIQMMDVTVVIGNQSEGDGKDNDSTGSNRLRWMTEEEITSKGITKGCKTILERVAKLSVRCNSNDDDDDGEATIPATGGATVKGSPVGRSRVTTKKNTVSSSTNSSSSAKVGKRKRIDASDAADEGSKSDEVVQHANIFEKMRAAAVRSGIQSRNNKGLTVKKAK